MKPRSFAFIVMIGLLTVGSLSARATQSPTLTTFCYWYNMAWHCSNSNNEFIYACDDGDTQCYYVANFCEGDNPDVGTAFEMWFDFSSSGAFQSAAMWDTDEHLNEVYNTYYKSGSNWMLYSDDGINIEWDLETGPAYVGRFYVSLSGTTYSTYVFAQRVPCK